MSIINPRGLESAPDLRRADAAPVPRLDRVDAGGPGHTGPGGRKSHTVRWLPTDAVDSGMFLDALTQAFGGRICKAVAREFGLAPGPGVPLSRRQLRQASDAAELGRQAMEGVQFAAALTASEARHPVVPAPAGAGPLHRPHPAPPPDTAPGAGA